MFKCIVKLIVPNELVDRISSKQPKRVRILHREYATLSIAEYDNFVPPGLQVGNEVLISDWEVGWGEDGKFTFLAKVTKHYGEISPQPLIWDIGTGERHKDDDIYTFSIVVEAADKESLSRIVEILEQHDMGQFEC